MFNILFVSHEAVLTGAPINLYRLIMCLNRNKFNPFFFSPLPGPIIEKLAKEKIETLCFQRNLTYKLSKFIKKKKIDLVHVNTKLATYGAFAGKLRKTKVLWHIHEDLSEGIGNRFLIKIINKMSDKIVVVSRKRAEPFISQGVTKIEMIYNGVDLQEFNSDINGEGVRKEFNIDASTPLLGIIATIELGKGHHTLIRSLKEIIKIIPNLRVLIVGKALPFSKKYLKKIKVLIQNLKLSHAVRFTGSREDIPDIIQALDLLILPSLNESFGRVLIEAMALRKPVVATEVGGIPEVVEKDVTGLLVPPEDPGALAKAIIFLLKNPLKASEMGKKGRERVEKYFTLHRHVKRIEEIYEELLMENHPDLN